MIVGRAVFVQFVELMLREIGDGEFFGAGDRARKRRQPVGQQFDQGRFAVAVGPEQRDAIIGVDAQRHAVQHRLRPVIADRDIVDGDDRR